MNKVILHISDLHVSMYRKYDQTLAKVDSYLTTNTDEASSIHFIEKFIEQVKSEFTGAELKLVITGDISNAAEVLEFTFAKKFITKIIEGLKISSADCMLLPGDHDVHRRSLENELERNPTSDSYLLNTIKFNNFSKLYSDIKGIDFPFDKVVVDYLIIDNKIVLVGINSNYKIGNTGGEGFIPIEEFKTEFENLKQKLNNEKLHYIAFWHHNITSGYENKNGGQWDAENRRHLLAELERQNIKLICTGNEHTSNSKTAFSDSMQTSDSGTLTSIQFDSTFKAYPITIDSNIILGNKIYALQRTNGNDLQYFWNVRTNSYAKQPEDYKIFVQNEQVINEEEIAELPSHNNSLDDPENLEEKTLKVVYNNTEKSQKLYNIVKDKKLFHSGHFHWSKTSRAHNWIDVSKLLEDNQDLFFVQNTIIDVIEKFNLQDDCNLIIGLGYEGNIISSKASIKFNIPYTSLPYSYRYNDHHDTEKKLNFENTDKKFKKVIVITDVVNDGRTIRKLIAKREDKFFSNVDKIVVISLFYTGSQDINVDILNYNKLPANYDFENDHEVNNIEFYTVKALRVERCPYGKNYKDECFIYKDELSCVHLFYDEESKT